MIYSNKMTNRQSKKAHFRCLLPLENSLNPIEEFVYSTGGKVISRWASRKSVPVHKVPIILLSFSKDMDFLDNTSNSHQ